MIRVVELVTDHGFADLSEVRETCARGILCQLSSMGYMSRSVDISEMYSYERMILVETNAPDHVLAMALDLQNGMQKNAYAVLVE